MRTFSAPGVYVIEDQSTPMPLSGVPTGTPCFFGFTQCGESLKPTRIKSFNEFLGVFGGRPANRVVFPRAYVADSVYAFFLNGGGECYVCRVNQGDRGFWTVKEVQDVVDYDRIERGISSQDSPSMIGFTATAISGGSWSDSLRIRAYKSETLKAMPMVSQKVELAPPAADAYMLVGRGRLRPISSEPIPPASGLEGATLQLGEDEEEAPWSEGAFQFKKPQTEALSGTLTVKKYQDGGTEKVAVPILVSYLPETSLTPTLLTMGGEAVTESEISQWDNKTRVVFSNVESDGKKKTLTGAWDGSAVRPGAEDGGPTGLFYFTDGDGEGFVLTAEAIKDAEIVGELEAPLQLAEGLRLTFDLEVVEAVPPRNPGDSTSYRQLEVYQGLSTRRDDSNYFLRAGVVNEISNRIELSELAADQGTAVAFLDAPREGDDTEIVSPLAPGGAKLENRGSDKVPLSTDYANYFPLLKAEPDVSLISCPDAYVDGETTAASDYQPIYQAAIKYAEENRCMVVIDPPPQRIAKELGDLNKRSGELEAFADRFRSTHAAIYAPWFKASNLDTAAHEKTLWVPPSGFILGAYNRSDNSVGVWKSPANIPVLGPVGMQLDFTEDESEVLNPAGVNLIRSFPGQGLLIWGARTSTKNVMWRYVNVRRLFLYVERTLKQQTMWAVFESNDQRTWNKLVNAAEAFLRQLWRDGGLMGATPEEAFQVQCGVPQTMTMTDVYNGVLKVEVKIAPVRPAEFVVFTVSQLVQQQS